jgi:hypothetical protein
MPAVGRFLEGAFAGASRRLRGSVFNVSQREDAIAMGAVFGVTPTGGLAGGIALADGWRTAPGEAGTVRPLPRPESQRRPRKLRMAMTMTTAPTM